MCRAGRKLFALLLAATICAGGCRARESYAPFDAQLAYLQDQAREVEYPDAVSPPRRTRWTLRHLGY